jgi:hypothetical protein
MRKICHNVTVSLGSRAIGHTTFWNLPHVVVDQIHGGEAPQASLCGTIDIDMRFAISADGLSISMIRGVDIKKMF